MSWLLGLGPKKDNFGNLVPDSIPTVPATGGTPPIGGDDGDKSDKDSPKAWANFDPSGLERAAKAARELDKSPNATQALEITKLQEINKQTQYQAALKENEAALEQLQIKKVQVQGEERRKNMTEETKQNNQRAQYSDQLARKRYDDQLEQQKAMNEENLRKQEESVQKQEAMRRASVEHEMELKHQNDMKTLAAKMEAKAKIERENKDIHMDKIRLESAEYRETLLESIKTAGVLAGTGISNFLADWDKIFATAMGLSLVAVGVYSAKMGIGVTSRFIESRLGKPSLVRETSRTVSNISGAIRHPIKTAKKAFVKADQTMKGIILEKDLNERLHEIALATSNTKMNGGVYRNLLLYGPPGTGKTMFAKSLAYHSKLDYAIMTGGDIAPMGRDGVTAMHKVFNWAETSNKGLLLFIDEADAFLRRRSTEQISEDLRSSLNAFLYRTGESSKKFMIVLASNQPDQFDWAIANRIDEMVEFKLPTLEEREMLVQNYFEKYILNYATRGYFFGIFGRRPIKVANFNFAEKCRDIARATDGLSGREISKLGVAWQSSTYASEDGELTEEILDARVSDMITQHKQKVEWLKEDSPENVSYLEPKV